MDDATLVAAYLTAKLADPPFDAPVSWESLCPAGSKDQDSESEARLSWRFKLPQPTGSPPALSVRAFARRKSVPVAACGHQPLRVGPGGELGDFEGISAPPATDARSSPGRIAPAPSG